MVEGYGFGGVGGIFQKHFVAPAVQAGSKPLPVAVRDGYQHVIPLVGQRLNDRVQRKQRTTFFFVHK